MKAQLNISAYKSSSLGFCFTLSHTASTTKHWLSSVKPMDIPYFSNNTQIFNYVVQSACRSYLLKDL